MACERPDKNLGKKEQYQSPAVVFTAYISDKDMRFWRLHLAIIKHPPDPIIIYETGCSAGCT
jgi:hypothetical protein